VHFDDGFADESGSEKCSEGNAEVPTSYAS